MKSILFVCTGNIFRSMVAEYVLKAAMGPSPLYRAGSAGTGARPQPVSPLVRSRLLARGIDPGGHQQRRVTAELLAETDLVVAMGLDHRAFLEEHFGQQSRLFNQICTGQETAVLDVWEAVPDWRENEQAGQSYTVSVVDHIREAMPTFLKNVERYLPREGSSD